MEVGGVPVVALAVIAAVVVAGLAVALVDLSRHEVRHLPKWAWALVIVLVNFPIGAVVYALVGRIPHGEGDPVAEPVAPQPDRRDRLADALGRDAGHASPSRWTPAGGDTVVATHGLAKRYGATAALDGVDLAVPSGATYGLIGPNGAGKTTLLSLLAGLRRPTAGRVELGVPRQRMGVLVDTPQFEPWLTAWEVVDLARRLTAPELPGARVEQVLDEVGLLPVADRRAGGFSRGMLQRLGLAGCLVGDPDVLLLDEPSSALDPAGRREVLDLIGRLAHTKTVLLSTHILADVQQVADVVGVIDHGRLRFQGPLDDLLSRTSSVYALHVRGETTALLAALRDAAWVQEVGEQAPGRVRLVVSSARRAEREVPRLIAAASLELASFNPATDLETAFLELTR